MLNPWTQTYIILPFHQSVQSAHLQSDHSDPHSEYSEPPKRVLFQSQETLGQEKTRFGQNIILSCLLQRSVPVKKSAKPQQAPEYDQQQDSTDPVFYMEVDMSDLPSQYAEEMETFRYILDLPDPRETLPRSSTTVIGLDDEKGQ